MNLHTMRSGGFAGVAFVVLLIVSIFITGVGPDNTASVSSIAAYTDSHRVALLIGGWLGLPAVVLFVWYAIGLFRWLSNAEPDEGLPLFALVNAVIASALSIVGSVIGIALVFHPSSELGPQVIRGLYDVESVMGALTFGSVAFFIFGVAYSGQRHQSLPAWLCWLGYLFALGNLETSLTSMYNSGPMALGGILGLFLGLIPLGLWVILSAFVMLGKGASAAAR